MAVISIIKRTNGANIDWLGYTNIENNVYEDISIKSKGLENNISVLMFGNRFTKAEKNIFVIFLPPL